MTDDFSDDGPFTQDGFDPDEKDIRIAALESEIAYLRAWKAWAIDAAESLCSICQVDTARVLRGGSDHMCKRCAPWIYANPEPLP